MHDILGTCPPIGVSSYGKARKCVFPIKLLANLLCGWDVCYSKVMNILSTISSIFESPIFHVSSKISLEANIREYKYLWLAVSKLFTLGSTVIASDTRLIVKME